MKNEHKHVFDEADHAFLNGLIDQALQRPHWIQIAVLKTLSLAMRNIQTDCIGDKSILDFFERGCQITRFYFEWHPYVSDDDFWHRPQRELMQDGPPATRAVIIDRMVQYSNWFVRCKALRHLTKETVVIIEDGKQLLLPPPNLVVAFHCMSLVERDDRLDDLHQKVHLGQFLSSVCGDTDPDSLRERAVRERSWKTIVVLNGDIHPIEMRATISPMVNDKDKQQAHFELRFSLNDLKPVLAKSGGWQPETLGLVWEQLQEQVNRRIDWLEAESFRKVALFPNPFSNGDQARSHAPAVVSSDIITVDVEQCEVTVKGNPSFEVTYDEAVVLKILHDAAPHAPSSTEVYRKKNISNHVRTLNSLLKKPKPAKYLKEYIKRKRGGGCWMTTK